MIDYKQVQNYIETKNNIKLKPFQILALKAIIRGETIFLPRGTGYTTLYKGYAEFLIEKISKNKDCKKDYLDYDVIFNFSDIKNQLDYPYPFSDDLIEDRFKKEYFCNFTKSF